MLLSLHLSVVVCVFTRLSCKEHVAGGFVDSPVIYSLSSHWCKYEPFIFTVLIQAVGLESTTIPYICLLFFPCPVPTFSNFSDSFELYIYIATLYLLLIYHLCHPTVYNLLSLGSAGN